uniref:CCHC-type domain-containing protein n=1 Tax=Romanomermis culicivorax TaxID=13658 RepID=A0A915IH81_ROMCU
MLDVYVNIMQAAQSAESSSPAIHGGSKNVHALPNNSPHDSDRYLNHGRDQSLNQSKRPQSPMRSKHCRGCSSTRHMYLSLDRKAMDIKCYDCGRTGHFPKYCEPRQGKSNRSSDEGKAVKMIHLLSVKHSAAAPYECTFGVIHLNGKDCYASGIVDSGAKASLLAHSLYMKWIGAPLSKSNNRLFSFNNTEIAGLRVYHDNRIQWSPSEGNSTCSRYHQSCDLRYGYNRDATIGHPRSHMTNQLCPTH